MEESFLTEILQEVAKEMGVTFVFKFMPWKRCELAIERMEAWGAIPYVPTPERESKFYFSDKLYHRQSFFFAYRHGGRKDEIRYSRLTDLKGYRIGGVRGYYYLEAFREAGLDVDFVITEEQNFRKLLAGRVDLIPSDEVLGWYLVKKVFPSEEVGNVYILPKPYNVSGDFLITSKQYPDTKDLLAKFNTSLKKIKGNGGYQRILDKHRVALTY